MDNIEYQNIIQYIGIVQGHTKKMNGLHIAILVTYIMGKDLLRNSILK